MAGLFGNGILGAYQQQGDPQLVGILSALKDAGAYLGGGGTTDNFAKFQQQNQQSQAVGQLVSGLQSDDPATRQQAYAIAPLFGVDPSAFQKQRAAQALPQLLTSMKPHQENVAALQLDNGASTPAFDYQVPGMSFTDAIAQSNSPELTAQYGDEVVKQMMAGPKFQEVGGGLYELPKVSGEAPTQVIAPALKAPTTRTVRMGTTDVTQEFDNKTGQWREVGRGVAFKPEDAPEQPDPATVQYWAQSVAAGQPLPALGMGKEAAMYRQAILKGAAQINSGKGLTGVDQNVNMANIKANSGALAKQTQLRSATEGFENTMLQNMNVVRDLIKSGAGTTGVPLLNRYQQYLRGEFAGDPEVIKLKNAIDTVADENAKIRSGTLGNTPATDAMRHSIREGLNSSMTGDQILGAFDVMERDAGNRSRALRAQEEAIRKGMRGGSDLPQIPGIREPQAASPQGPAASPASLPQKGGAKIRVFNPATGRLE